MPVIARQPVIRPAMGVCTEMLGRTVSHRRGVARGTALGALVFALWAQWSLPANAMGARTQNAAAPGLVADHHTNNGRVVLRSGNGRFNKNYATVFSPTVNRGLQQVSNTNISGQTPTQVAFCKRRHRICNISQRLWASGW